MTRRAARFLASPSDLGADGGPPTKALAFDPERQAILLVAGDKAGVAQKRFYKGLIAEADSRFNEHLKAPKEI